MGIIVNSFGNPFSATGQSGELPAPATITDDDRLVAFLYVNNDVTLTLDEAGWVQEVDNPVNIAGDMNVAIWHAKAASESGTYTVTISGGQDQQIKGIIGAYTGVDLVTPFDVASTTAEPVDTDVATPPPITTVTNDAFILSLAGALQTIPAGSKTQPAGYTKRLDNRSTNSWIGVADFEKAVFGLETVGTWSTFTAATTDFSIITAALRPAGAATNDGAAMYHHLQNMGYY